MDCASNTPNVLPQISQPTFSLAPPQPPLQRPTPADAHNYVTIESGG